MFSGIGWNVIYLTELFHQGSRPRCLPLERLHRQVWGDHEQEIWSLPVLPHPPAEPGVKMGVSARWGPRTGARTPGGGWPWFQSILHQVVRRPLAGVPEDLQFMGEC